MECIISFKNSVVECSSSRNLQAVGETNDGQDDEVEASLAFWSLIKSVKLISSCHLMWGISSSMNSDWPACPSHNWFRFSESRINVLTQSCWLPNSLRCIAVSVWLDVSSRFYQVSNDFLGYYHAHVPLCIQFEINHRWMNRQVTCTQIMFIQYTNIS